MFDCCELSEVLTLVANFLDMYSVWIAGFPSYYGGADTELDHLIDLFRYYDVQVNLVPMFGADRRMRESILARGCSIHDYAEGIFREKTVVSYCNGQFLAHLPEIVRSGRPARVIWFNCMTWLFEAEKHAHAEGWIDCFGFQSRYQASCLIPQLERLGPVRTFDYRPFFSFGRVSFGYRPWNGTYRLGRASRDDMAKFSADTWRIFDRVLVPRHLQKKVYILGYGPKATEKIGRPPDSLDWQTWGAGAIPASRFWRTIDTMVHKTGGSRENYPRVLLEAYAHGVVPIVEDAYGLRELVVHSETGYLTSDSDEMSYYASMLAANPAEHRRLAVNGRRHLEERLVSRAASFRAWEEALSGDERAHSGEKREPGAHRAQKKPYEERPHDRPRTPEQIDEAIEMTNRSEGTEAVGVGGGRR
jgi:glycosyltransferase involved in cell wall biosynthesis